MSIEVEERDNKIEVSNGFINTGIIFNIKVPLSLIDDSGIIFDKDYELNTHRNVNNIAWSEEYFINYNEGDRGFNIENYYEGVGEDGEFLYGQLFLAINTDMKLESSYNFSFSQ